MNNQIKIKQINSHNTNSLNRSIESNSIKTHPNLNDNRKHNLQTKILYDKEEKEYILEDSCDNTHNCNHNNQRLNQSRGHKDMKNSQSFSEKQTKPLISYITNNYIQSKKSNDKFIKKNKSCLNVNINTKLTISNNMSFYNPFPPNKGIIQTQPNKDNHNRNNNNYYYSNTNHKKNYSFHSNTPIVTSQTFINTPCGRNQTHSNISFGNTNNSNNRHNHKISLITKMNKMKITPKQSDNSKKTSQSALWNNKFFN